MAFMPDNKIANFSGLLDVFKKFIVADLLPYFHKINIGFEETSLNSVINAIFWCSVVFGLIFYYFNKFLQLFLKSAKVKRYKWRQTIHTVWNICFFLASSVFLDIYHSYSLAPQILRETGRYFPKYENALFLISDDIRKFNTISLILITYYIITAFIDLKTKDYLETATKVLYGCVLINFYYLGYENFSVILNVNMGIFNFITEIITLLALHTSDKNDALFKFYVFLRFISWSYVFLTLLPFKYLIPTLYAKNFKLWLNIFFWLWYGSSVWNSPLLQYFYHHIFHIHPSDCIGGNSSTRCILLKDSQELRHYNNLQKAVMELKIAKEKKNLTKTSSENASAKAFQSIKCLMMLKRKLKRIRGNKLEASESHEHDAQPVPTEQQSTSTTTSAGASSSHNGHAS